MTTQSTGVRRGIFGSTAATLLTSPRMNDSPTNEGKRIVAAKIASVVGAGGAPTRVINAFIQVKDYTGLDRYLSKHQIPLDILTSSLQKACMISDSQGVEIFARHGANVNYVDQFGTTLLHFAMRGGGDEQVIRALVMHGLDYCGWRSDGMPLLHWACSMGFLNLIEYIVEQSAASLQEVDDNGRLPIHVAAVSGQPNVLSYLIQALSERLCLANVPPQFREALEETHNDGSSDTNSEHNHESNTLRVRRVSQFPKRKTKQSAGKKTTYVDEISSARNTAASNYMDVHQWTPLHHASCEEAINCYQDCMKLLLDHGADPMLPTLQGKTALDLAYAAGRSQVLVDVLPKRQFIALLMRIDDIVPPHVRRQHAQQKAQHVRPSTDSVLFPETASGVMHGPFRAELSPESAKESGERTRKGYSFIRRIADNLDPGGDGYSRQRSWTGKGYKSDSANVMTVWRKILLNDNVELLETLRDSMVWRQQKQDISNTDTDFSALVASTTVGCCPTSVMTEFETAQKLSLGQMSELFSDCYENGTGVYSHVQANYQNILKSGDFRTVLRGMTGLLTFETLSTNKVVILRPMYKSLLFLAIICGRFRVAEQLLRMRQFDMLPSAVLVTLILRRLRKEPSFPQQVQSELSRFTDHIETIAVDVLNMVFMKDNTPEKRVCRDMLPLPLRSFGDVSLIDLCARAKCRQLLSLPYFQRLLDERWDGILMHVPTWIRWPIKLFPLIGIIYLDYKTRQQQTRAIQLQSRSSLHTSPLSTRHYFTDSHFSDPMQFSLGDQTTVQTQNQSTCCPCFSSKATKMKHMQFSSRHTRQKTVNDDSCSLKVQPTASVYDRVVGVSNWRQYPRCYFVLSVYRCPSTKFFFHSLFHLAFLFFFSAICLFGVLSQVTIAELIVVAYVTGYALEEFRQLLFEGMRDGWREYFKDVWNWMDMCAIGFTIAGFCIKLTAPSYPIRSFQEAYDSTLSITRNFYMISLSLFYVRTLYITSISKTIGPRLKMMNDMLRKDLVPLLVVFFICIFSFGVWFQGLIYPNSFYEKPHANRTYMKMRASNSLEKHQLPWKQTFKELFKRAFYNMFELSMILDEMSCEENVYCGYPLGFDIVIYFVFVLYTGIVNIILINLLIALFSNTVSRIEQESTAHWMASRYKMVKEYTEQTVLPPPLNIFCILYELVHCIVYHCRRCYRRKYSRVNRPEFHCIQRKIEKRSDYGELCSDLSEPDEVTSHGVENSKGESRFRARNTRQLLTMIGSMPDSEGSTDYEADVVMKFILVQSFALQDRRPMLGYRENETKAGMRRSSDSSTDKTSVCSDNRSHELQEFVKHLSKRLENLENTFDKVIAKVEEISTMKNLGSGLNNTL